MAGMGFDASGLERILTSYVHALLSVLSALSCISQDSSPGYGCGIVHSIERSESIFIDFNVLRCKLRPKRDGGVKLLINELPIAQ